MDALIRAIFLANAAIAAAPQPTFVAQPGRVVAVTLPATLLAEKTVQRQLASGLTTTFVLRSQWGGGAPAAAKLEIRYDVWEETWRVRRIEFDGHESRDVLPSKDALEKWWSAPTRILAANSDRIALRLTLTALPFSAAEAEDARQWIAKSKGATQSGSPLVSALIGTTLDAKPIQSWQWRTEIAFK